MATLPQQFYPGKANLTTRNFGVEICDTNSWPKFS